MITFEELSWDYMFSYGPGNKIQLNKSPVTQLIGLNGNGKSSIPLILEEVLFNRNSKGTKRQDVLNRNSTSKSYSAKLTFRVDEDKYEIHIKRASTHSVKLIKNGTDVSGHTATQTLEAIETLLGYDFKTFSQVEYQNSTSSLQFLTATDTNRKKFLIDILLLDRYVELFEKFKDHHKQVSERLAKTKAVHDSTVVWLSKYEKENLEEKETVEVPSYPKELEIEAAETKAKHTDADAKNTRISKNEQYKKLRDSLPGFMSLEAKRDASELTKKVGVLDAQKRAATTLKAKVTSLGATCPTCMQLIDQAIKESLIKSADSEIFINSLELSNVNMKLAEINAHNELVNKNERIMQEFEKYSGLIDKALPSLLVDKSELTKSLSELSERIDKAKTAIKLAETINTAAINHNARIRTIVEQMDSYKDKLRSSQSELDTLSEELSYLEVLKKAFSTNGLLAYKIENSVKELELMTNHYLTELSYGRFQISYAISNDKLNVVITDNGKDVTIEALSAGELARVTTATLLAIRKLMSKISKNKINSLFLDETIDTLDADGRDKLIELLLAEPDINVFLISHSFTHPLLDKVSIIKENNISRLEEV
jgi:DNA repair exonuclease SbcCD ATPase subunit